MQAYRGDNGSAVRRSTLIALVVILAVASSRAQGPAAELDPGASPAQPVASMAELMVDLIYPASDTIFYVSRAEPANGVEWNRLQLNALALAESANLLMAPERARDREQWMADARLLLDAGRAAYRGAKARDYDALVALNAELYEACQSCHEHYRPGYRRRP
jgi:hypothetical protein